MNPCQKFIFSTNHADPLMATTLPFPGFLEAALLSAQYSSAASIKKVIRAKSEGALIISDNGNFSRMSKIAKKFIAKGNAIQNQAEIQLKTTGKVSDELMLQRELLMQDLVDACQKEFDKTPHVEVVTKQMKSSPDYLIALEDFVIPVATMVGLLRSVFSPDPLRVLPYQQHTLDTYLKQKAGFYGNSEALGRVRKYIVLHAYDYASARQGAAALRDSEVEGIAISFGGPMASKEYVQYMDIGSFRHSFSEKLPEAYLIAIAIVAGALNGLHNKNLPIHILGLGSPILIAILGYLLRDSTAVSIDATSTFKDADDGNIFALEPAFMKLDMYKVLAYALIQNQPYFIGSPHFAAFEKQFPTDLPSLRQALNVLPKEDPRALASRLKTNPKLIETYAPYFTPMRKGTDALIKAVRVARSGSNYWVLKQICEQVRANNGDKAASRRWLQDQANRYMAIASPKWAKVMGEIIKWINIHGL